MAYSADLNQRSLLFSYLYFRVYFACYPPESFKIICLTCIWWKIRLYKLSFFAKPATKSFQSPHVRDSRTVLDSGFHAVDSGFRVLDSGFQHSGFRIPKRAGFHIFSGFNAFLRTSFSCSNLAMLKDVVITSLFSFSIYKITSLPRRRS